MFQYKGNLVGNSTDPLTAGLRKDNGVIAGATGQVEITATGYQPEMMKQSPGNERIGSAGGVIACADGVIESGSGFH